MRPELSAEHSRRQSRTISFKQKESFQQHDFQEGFAVKVSSGRVPREGFQREGSQGGFPEGGFPERVPIREFPRTASKFLDC